MKNKIVMILLSALLAISLSGCDENVNNNVSSGAADSDKQIEKDVTDVTNVEDEVNDKKEDKQDKEDDKDNDKKEEDKQDKKSEKVTKTVKVYYSDEQAENLVEKEIDIELSEGESLEEKTLQSLKIKPKDSKTFNAVDENIKFNSVKVQDKIATVDLSGDNLNGASTQEAFLIDSVVAALTSLDTVDKVQFVVDGEKVESLMGHIEVTKPFTKDDISSNIIK